MSISNSEGHTIGGHLLEGNRVYTTAEIVLGIMPQFEFSREKCHKSGWDELKVYRHD